MSTFQSLEWLIEAIRAWPQYDPPSLPARDWEVDVHRRLADALDDSVSRPGKVGSADLAGLVAHVLRREMALGSAPLTLRAPCDSPWPTADGWARAGVRAVQIGDRLRIEALPWEPTWLDSPTALRHVFAETKRRTPDPLPADPMLIQSLGHCEYRGEGQRQAVRTLFAAPQEATVVAALPTGTGKSAVAYAPALEWSRYGGVSVIVVPTIALALDQERALRDAFQRLGRQAPVRFAYHGGLTDDERRAVRSAVRDGSQGIVFAGPESVTGSLAPALYAAAESGRLKLFAIDEAHLVSAWGAEFRPEFQALAGLRSELLTRAQLGGRSFPTLLMTATLTEEALRTLADLFGRPGPFLCVPSLVLRPEPSHWLVACNSHERKERVLEAIQHAPRPLIVYTTTVEDARRLEAELRASSYARVAGVTGKTGGDRRLEVILGFAGTSPHHADPRTEIDVVVATSAFGLGVDNAHVRTVLHACIPETIDRYYQEVGRAGRDGRASLALLLHAPEDLDVAKSLAATKIITPELALKRWQAMSASSRDLGDGRLRVSLRALHARLVEDTDANRAWNQRTLGLLARAGLLDLVAEGPPPLPPGDPDDPGWELARKAQLDEYFTSQVVVPQGDVEEALQSASIQAVRGRTRDADRRGLDLMLEALAASRDLADVLLDAYTVKTAPGAWEGFAPDRSCGGCPVCRREGRAPYEGVSPSPPPLRCTAWALKPDLDRMLSRARERRLTVIYERGDRRLRRDLAAAVAKCARQGVTSVVGPQWLRDQKAVREAHLGTERGAVFLDQPPVNWFRLAGIPTMIVHPPESPDTLAPPEYFSGGRAIPARILIVPSDLGDPDRPNHTVAELHPPVRTLEQLLNEL